MQAIEPERIVAAAIKLNNGALLSGIAHYDCYSDLVDYANCEDPVEKFQPVDGFLTSSGRFVTRENAWKMAVRSGQLGGKPFVTGKLDSEHLRVESAQKDEPECMTRQLLDSIAGSGDLISNVSKALFALRSMFSRQPGGSMMNPWTEGGCNNLAHAVAAILDRGGVPYEIMAEEENGCIEHIFVYSGGKILDAYPTRSRVGLLSKSKKLAAFADTELSYSPESTKKLINLLDYFMSSNATKWDDQAHSIYNGTANGRFGGRDEAFEIATQSRQIDPSERYFYGHHGNLASEELPDMRESTRRVLTAIVEELYGGVISVDMVWEFNTVQTHIGIVSRNTIPGELPYRLTVMEYKDGEDPLVHVDISKTEADKVLAHVLVRRVVNELENITCAAVIKFH